MCKAIVRLCPTAHVRQYTVWCFCEVCKWRFKLETFHQGSLESFMQSAVPRISRALTLWKHWVVLNVSQLNSLVPTSWQMSLSWCYHHSVVQMYLTFDCFELSTQIMTICDNCVINSLSSCLTVELIDCELYSMNSLLWSTMIAHKYTCVCWFLCSPASFAVTRFLLQTYLLYHCNTANKQINLTMQHRSTSEFNFSCFCTGLDEANCNIKINKEKLVLPIQAGIS